MAELNSPSTGIVDAQSGGMIHSESTGIIDETQGVEQPVQEAIPQEVATPTGIEEEEEKLNIGNEIAAVVGGGAVDAVESVGGFAELTGDTIKTGLNSLLGHEVDQTQNPFDDDYIHGDGNFLNIPDQITDWNGNVMWEDADPKTAIGKFGRGLVEFGLLTAATGGVGGATVGGAKVGIRGIAAARAMGVGAKGARYLNFVRKGVKIGSEGAIADLISSSSEHANIMNLAQENIPWAVPIIGDMIAVKPEDNPWTARFKSIAAGAGLNYVGHGIGAIYKGFWEAGRAKIKGATDEAANLHGNKVAAEDFEANMGLDEVGRTEMALDDFQRGLGKSRAEPRDEFARSYGTDKEYEEWAGLRGSELDEDVVRSDELFAEFQRRGQEAGDEWDDSIQSNTNRILDDESRGDSPFVNDDKFSQTEQATYTTPEKGAVETHVKQAIESNKATGDAGSYADIISEPYLKAVARGDRNILQYIKEVAEDLATASSKGIESTLDWADVKKVILKQANDILEILEEGGDLGKVFKDALDDPNNKDFRLYADGGQKLVTISPTQKAANVLVMNALGKKVHAIATGSMTITPGATIGRQADMVFDQLKVLLMENKKMGMMWGLDGKAQQEFLLSPDIKRMKRKGLDVMRQQNDEYFNTLRGLLKEERWQELEDLMELHTLSGGKVRTLHHIHEYLRSTLRGGRMDDVHIKGRVRKELQGTFFNSVLSSFATPVKAVLGTNMLAVLRPMQAWMGAGIRGKQREMFIAASQMDNMGKAWAESLQLAKHNWELGVKKKGQSYQGKFDYDADLKEWKNMKKFYERYGSNSEKLAYGALDKVVDMNNMPWVRYSVNAMGAGDAAARTIIGRQYMRQRAAAKVWDEATDLNHLDPKSLKRLAEESEEAFRGEIFKTDQYGFSIVSDKGASMAGDEAAMTRGLQENFKGFELISNIPGMKAFFPFVRTGFNYLDVTFQHTPLQIFRDKYYDIKQLADSPNPSQQLLNKYGIRAQDAQYELALMEGRMAMGTSIIGLASLAALSGRITGDLPVNKEDRDLWKLNGVKPKSFILPNGTYVSYEKLEIFNTIFSTTANVVGNADLLGEKRTDEWMKKLTYMTAAVVVDQSMLSGVEDLARLMNPQTAEDLLLQTGTRYLRSHLPYAGLMGQIGDVVDSNQKEANSFLELLAKRDAAFKGAIPSKYDILNKDRSGQPLRYGPEQPLHRLFNSMLPLGFTTPEGDEVKETLMALRFNLPETMSTYRGEPLNSLEKSEMSKILSQSGLRKDLERLFKKKGFKRALSEYKTLKLKESDGYKLKDQLFYREVQKIFRHHKALAMQKMLSENAGLSGRLLARNYQKNMGKVGNYSDTARAKIDYLLQEFPK